ncbi:MAG: hypothetical protein ACTSQ4_03715 [Candidatus Heimdallarchaeaceae archaeon]
MKLMKIIVKGQKKAIIIEYIVILLLLIIASFSFSFYLSEYHEEWSNLLLSNEDPDFEVQIEQNFSYYLSNRSLYSNHFNNYNYQNIVILPNILANIEIKNESIQVFNLVLINSQINDISNYSLNDNEVIVQGDNLANVKTYDVSVDWNFPAVNGNLTTLFIANETYFEPVFSPTTYLFAKQELFGINVIITESFFFKVVRDTGSSVLENIAANEITIVNSFFRMNKTVYFNLLPNKLKEDYAEWTKELRGNYFQFYDIFPITSEIQISISFNDVFNASMMKMFQEMNSLLVSSFFIVILISSVFLYSAFAYFKQNQKEFGKIMQILNSRGGNYSSISKRLIFLHIWNTTISILVSLLANFVFIAIIKINDWSYSRLLIIIVHIVAFIPIIAIQISLISEIDLGSIFKEEKKMLSSSKSEILGIIIQIVSVILGLLAIIVFWIINRTSLQSENLSSCSIWYISVSFCLFILLLFIIPRFLMHPIERLFRRLLAFFTPIHLYLTKALVSAFKSKKKLLTLSFFLLFFSSLLTAGYTTLRNHQSQFYESMELADISLITEASTITEIITICGRDNCIVSYLDSTFTDKGYINVIYIENPIKFYENAYFPDELFNKFSNREVFNLLNLSSNNVITSSSLANSVGYKIGENISIPRTNTNLNIEFNIKELIDFAVFLPYFFPQEFFEWFLLKYDKNESNLTKFQYSIVSIKDQNNNINSLISYLDEHNLWYSIISDDSYEYPHETLVAALRIPVLLMNIAIPFMLIIIFIDLQRACNNNLRFLKLRGMKNSLSRLTFTSWLFIFIFSISFTSLIIAIFGLNTIVYITNTKYGLPVQLSLTGLNYLIQVVALIFSIFMPLIASLIPKIFRKRPQVLNLVLEGELKNE